MQRARYTLLAAAVLVLVSFAGCLGAVPSDALDSSRFEDGAPADARVVVAQFDTGTNPFHPCMRRSSESPWTTIPDYPRDARPLNLTFTEDYKSSLAASQPALDAIQDRTLYYVPGTALSYYGADGANQSFVDQYPHGAQASSQIVCEEFGMASEAHLVVLNWYTGDGDGTLEMLQWTAEQAWIDIVHLNIQDVPLPQPDAFSAAISKLVTTGKFVVIAGGNGVAGGGVNYPMELSRYNGPRGTLIAGANDNGGYTVFSNLNPHVVMDGSGTVAAAPYSFETATFGGTSSASPRTTGYVAHLLYMVRSHFGHVGGSDANVLVRVDVDQRPAVGPLADGELTVAELHQVVRSTADPNPHDSKYDGGTSTWWLPQPVQTPIAVYAKMGYGEVSEHTIEQAFAVIAGDQPLPQRYEDAFFMASELQRDSLWG